MALAQYIGLISELLTEVSHRYRCSDPAVHTNIHLLQRQIKEELFPKSYIYKLYIDSRAVSLENENHYSLLCLIYIGQGSKTSHIIKYIYNKVYIYCTVNAHDLFIDYPTYSSPYLSKIIIYKSIGRTKLVNKDINHYSNELNTIYWISNNRKFKNAEGKYRYITLYIYKSSLLLIGKIQPCGFLWFVQEPGMGFQ